MTVLGTNYTASDNEKCSVKYLVESMKQELSSLDQVLLPLPAKREKLNAKILAHEALLTPARRLIPEIVSEIFTHTIYSESSEFFCDRFSGAHLLLPYYRTPLKLGSICRRWRQIALSTPSIWSAVDIPLHWGVGALQEWIRRAASCSLSFSVDIQETNFEVLKLLASYQRRWKEVALYFDTSPAGSQLFRKFLESLTCSYDNLQTLDIHRTDQIWMEPGNQSTDIELSLASAPNLRFLFLHAPGCKIVSPHTLPFLNLREVKVDSDPIPIPAADVLALLRLSPAVEVVYACVLHTHNRSDSGNDILNLAHLKDLKILEWLESGQEGHVLCPLEELNSPALERLSFKVAVNGPQDPSFLPTYGPQLRSLIFRSRPPVTVLKIQWCRIPAADLMYSIPFLPNLVCIDIEFIGASDDWDGVLELLTGPVPPSDENLSGCMCPQLNEIFLGRDNKANPDLVADMICSRSPVGCSKLLPHPKIKDCIVGGMQYLSGGRGGDWGYPDSNDL